MMNYKIIIAIDPDVEKSGVSVLYKVDKSVESCNKTLRELISFLRNYAMLDDVENNLIVLVEGGYLNEGNYHLRAYINNKYASRIGHDIGRNHQVALDIIEIIKSCGLQVKVVRPLRKCWKGADGKITHAELERVAEKNGYSLTKKRTNQDERDAILLSLVYAVDNLKL